MRIVKKGIPHREGYFLYGEITQDVRHCPLLSKLSVMVAAQKHHEKAAIQIGGPFGEQSR
ncbi:hypothetical protein H5410_005227 [Solanum commersonii]|uniref:Uncharacterized protein n=1 Tax=Solanum commersonii TaxID=4109 RepID=A0A9J6A636_SOLCO|nr:hypothetical protein H5410_005227 [Solanum commersonii]